jgi:hypothetical protein
MTSVQWVTVDERWCELLGRRVERLEKQLYPGELLPDVPAYRVLARKCSHSIACNIAEFPCKWAYTNPGSDRFGND